MQEAGSTHAGAGSCPPLGQGCPQQHTSFCISLLCFSLSVFYPSFVWAEHQCYTRPSMLHLNPYTSHPPNISKYLGVHPKPGPGLCVLCCQPMDWSWSSLKSLQLLGPTVSCGRELCTPLTVHHCNQLSAGVFCGRCRGGCLFLNVCCIPQLLPAAVLGETVTGCSLFTFSISVMSFS